MSPEEFEKLFAPMRNRRRVKPLRRYERSQFRSSGTSTRAGRAYRNRRRRLVRRVGVGVGAAAMAGGAVRARRRVAKTSDAHASWERAHDLMPLDLLTVT